MMKNLLKGLLAITVLGLQFCAQGQGGKKVLDAKSFSEALAKTPDALVLDVRTPEEFAGGHLNKAVNVDWNSGGFDAWSKKIDKEAKIFVYCLSGGRSGSAGAALRQAGFQHVSEMEGGIMKWKAAGLPLSGEGSGPRGIQKEEYEKQLHAGNQVVLVDFYAPWCGPCKKMKPELEKLEKENAAALKVVRIDADQNPDLSKELKVDALPVVLIYKEGQLQKRLEGYQSPAQLKAACGL
jgi:thioredoxin 1